MGANASKAAQAGARKFPSRAPGTVPPSTARAAAPQAPRAAQRTQSPKASFTKDDAIRADALDPTSPLEGSSFSQRLQQMGVVTPNPTLSNSSIATQIPHAPRSSPLGPRYPAPSLNATLSALEARRRIQEEVDVQFDNPAGGREYVDIGALRQALTMRQRGVSAPDIERRLRLRAGVVTKIESGGVIQPLGL
ncbi:hypothetical protein BX600DRAFT_44344 [Xylariales sp. PMI_506]|nr:hypothetical protein BX600DRAFT_44344 [Xylariales sp. PMI_506]